MSRSKSKRASPAEKAVGYWFLLFLLYPLLALPAIGVINANFGGFLRLALGFLIFAGFFVYLRWLYRWGDRISAARRIEVREMYPGIYRVKGPPSSKWSWLTENIQIDDYAWERPAWRRDDLIYLHGLQDQWGVVWMAGFRPEDVEYVTAKPVSEYDWRDFEYDGPKPHAPYNWGISKAKSACPFPVTTENRRIYKWRFPT